MHPEIVMDQPGKCPKCGMTLVPMKPEKKVSSAKVATAAERPTPKASASEAANEKHDHASHDRHQMHDMRQMSMQSSMNLAEPMSRESSGSSWVPDSTPMYGRMFMFGDDMLMLHGGIFPRYTNASTRRGDDRIDGPEWIMAM